MAKSFTMVVEQRKGIPGFEREVEWEGDTPPDIIDLPSGVYVKVAKYLSPGDRYCYRQAVVHVLLDEPVDDVA